MTQPLNFQPLYFEGGGGSLYGVHHMPNPGSSIRHGILIVPPLGQEYVRVHKTLQKLAADLAKIGFDVLRFDYTGTGDSDDSGVWDLNTWHLDSQRALTHLKSLSGAEKVSLIGIRLGASLAMGLEASADQLILWDPIANGALYLSELQSLHDELCNSPLYFPNQRRSSVSPTELAGHSLVGAMRDSLMAFDLRATMRVRASAITWLDAEPTDASARYEDFSDKLGDNCFHQRLNLACHWRSVPHFEKVLMGQPMARCIINCFKETVSSHAGSC